MSAPTGEKLCEQLDVVADAIEQAQDELAEAAALASSPRAVEAVATLKAALDLSWQELVRARRAGAAQWRDDTGRR